MNKLAALILTAPILAACAAGARAADALDRTSRMLPIPKGSSCSVPPVIEFGRGKASGDMGCNRFSSPYRLEGDRLVFENPAMTLKSCAPHYMELEESMKRVFKAERIRLEPGKALEFLDAGGKAILTLVPERAGACD
ncbi:MAG: META domain-containing protein [Duodenibacillus sp.]|nr:META domain-containing protein [Duodenibacillus sp.]